MIKTYRWGKLWIIPFYRHKEGIVPRDFTLPPEGVKVMLQWAMFALFFYFLEYVMELKDIFEEKKNMLAYQNR